MGESASTITITYDQNQTVSIDKGTRLEQLLQQLPPRPRKALAATVNGALQELDYPLYIDSQVQWIDYNCNLGWRIYRRSMIMLLRLACRELFPERQLWVSHSLAEGLFCRFQDGPDATVEETAALEKTVQAYIQQDLPVLRTQVSRMDAVHYLQENGNAAQADLLSRRKDEYLSLYCIKNQREYYFGRMITHTGLLGFFRLEPYEGGFVLRLPAREYLGCRPHNQVVAKQLHTTMASYDQWSALMGIRTISDLNQAVASGNDRLIELMLVAETLYERQLAHATDSILKDFPTARLVLLAGPSSSGKTTSTERLGVQFRTMGVEPIRISMDDYFLDREKTPLNDQGMKDYENLAALDLDLFHANMRDLLAGRETGLPRYDFKSGKSIHNDRWLQLNKDQILLVEGLHALNPQISQGIPSQQIRKFFISALTQINLDAYTPFSSSDNRLVRRMARDMQFRGISPAGTLDRWDEVRRGEHRNIFPYQEEADLFINSSLIYEMPVLRPLVETALEAITPDQNCYLEARRILRLVRYFEPAPTDIVPRTSILQEFIGNSLFHV